VILRHGLVSLFVPSTPIGVEYRALKEGPRHPPGQLIISSDTATIGWIGAKLSVTAETDTCPPHFQEVFTLDINFDI